MIVAQRDRNPYAVIDWEKCFQVSGCTHMHCTSEDILQWFLEDGLEFVTLSNYYPSVPWYPLASLRENFFKVRQPGYILGKEWKKDTLDINAEICGWQDKLALEGMVPPDVRRDCHRRGTTV